MDSAAQLSAGIAFGRFRVLPHRRELLADGQPVALGGRAFDVLMTLIEARGAVVTKDTLMARVWPTHVVEESNIQAQISALRSAFGPDRNLTRTISGRGYQFPADVQVVAAASDEPPRMTAPAAAAPSTNLPEPVSELIGRD